MFLDFIVAQDGLGPRKESTSQKDVMTILSGLTSNGGIEAHEAN